MKDDDTSSIDMQKMDDEDDDSGDENIKVSLKKIGLERMKQG